MRKNYTLIELLVAMGIFAFMMILLMNFFSTSTDLLTRENTRSEKLYEGGTFTYKLRQDLGKIITASNIYNIDYEYTDADTSDDNKTVKLRFFSNTYDNNGGQGNTLAVSYVYDKSTFSITRYVLTTDPSAGAGNFFDTANPATYSGTEFPKLENANNGAIILEGVEDLQFKIYENGGLATFTDVDNNDVGESKYQTTTAAGTINDPADHPDAMTFKVTLNNINTLEETTGGSIPDDVVENRRVGTRRTIAYQQLMEYK